MEHHKFSKELIKRIRKHVKENGVPVGGFFFKVPNQQTLDYCNNLLTDNEKEYCVFWFTHIISHEDYINNKGTINERLLYKHYYHEHLTCLKDKCPRFHTIEKQIIKEKSNR